MKFVPWDAVLLLVIVGLVIWASVTQALGQSTTSVCGDWRPLVAREFIRAGIPHLIDRGCVVIECESTNNPNAVGDVDIDGVGHSRGLWQISDYYHPDVSEVQAFDPAWSTRWAAGLWAAGRTSEWACYRILFVASPPPVPIATAAPTLAGHPPCAAPFWAVGLR